MPLETAPHGGWRSPVTATLAAAGCAGIEQVEIDESGVYWLEIRADEGGRGVVLRASGDGAPVEATPPGFDVRSRVHEYGGGAFALDRGRLYFSNFEDQRVYACSERQEPRPLTAPGPRRYADFEIDRRRDRVICVCEEHGAERRPRRALMTLDLRTSEGGQTGRPLIANADFFAAPRLDPAGSQLAWLSWSHPQMPWTGSELWLARVLHSGGLTEVRRVAGGLGESICQPEWSPDGELFFVSDRSGWWNICRLARDGVEEIHRLDAEFARPLTRFRLDTYAFESPHRIVCAFTRRGIWWLATLDTARGELRRLPVPHTEIGFVRAARGQVVFVGASPTEPESVVSLDLESSKTRVLRRTFDGIPERRWLSTPEALEFPSGGGLTAHGFFYPPCNPRFQAPPGELPPLLVWPHAGPTRACGNGLRLEVQFWTSRGIAILEVNYRGSSSFGREYRRRLDGAWGVIDVQDCVEGARFLVERGDVDVARIGIKGGSAGGFTALCALAFQDLFRAGSSYCGIADLELLRRETHDFEASYLEHLVGPYPETRERYRRRSPVHAASQIDRPLAFFYGLEDRVTPPNQAEALCEALDRRGVPVARFGAPGEGHGFRRTENRRRLLEMELGFFAEHLGFPANGRQSRAGRA